MRHKLRLGSAESINAVVASAQNIFNLALSARASDQ